MIELWIGVALLTVLAIAFIFLPFIKARRLLAQEGAEDREQQNIEIFRERLSELEQEKEAGNLEEEDFSALKLELERNLLSDVEDKRAAKSGLSLSKQALITVTLIAMMVPVASIGMYAMLGRSADLELSMQAPKDPFNGETPTLEQAIAQLEKELEMNPENPEGWFLLATTYMNQGRFAEGAAGFKQVLQLLPQEAPQYASVMGQYGQALFFASGSRFTDEVNAQIDATLELEPLEITSLGLKGIAAFEQEDFQTALDYWLQALRNADGNTAESLRSGVRKAREQLLAQGKEVPYIPELEMASVSLRVQLSPELLQQASADQTVFVFAREIGQRMPLAAVKLQVSDLPADVTLDDSKAMNPQANLSSASAVEVSARISTSGQPQEQAGDLYGLITPVPVRGNTMPLILTIDKVVE